MTRMFTPFDLNPLKEFYSFTEKDTVDDKYTTEIQTFGPQYFEDRNV